MPHSPQNFAPSGISVPQFVQNTDRASFVPHSGQNLPPSIFAEQLGQVTFARSAMSRSRVQSTSRTRSWICSTCACAWARDSSSATLGEQVRHWPISSFQQTASQTQSPHPRHWRNSSLHASTALASALSFAFEFVARSHWNCEAAFDRSATLPPSSDPALRSSPFPRSSLSGTNSERYPLPQRSQTNSNWYPSAFDRSRTLSVKWTRSLLAAGIVPAAPGAPGAQVTSYQAWAGRVTRRPALSSPTAVTRTSP